MSFAKLLASITKATPRTAAELRADVVKVDLPGLEAKVATIESERRAMLLRGTDADLAKNKLALDAASLDVERGQAAVDELTRLIGEAEARESAAAIERQAAEAQAAVDELARLYAKVDEVTANLQQIFAEAAPLAARVESWNQVGHRIGRPHISFTRLDVIKQRTAGALR